GSFPVRSVRRSLSTVTICETLATESLGSPVRRAERVTFPGAVPHLRLLVNGTQTVVARRLPFSASHCTTITGLLKPGPDPAGAAIRPPDFALGNYHSLRSRTRRAAEETNSSFAASSSEQALFIASVTLSGVWRARYSLRASLKRRLRDLLVSRAKRSAPLNTSSGIETAVFIPEV